MSIKTSGDGFYVVEDDGNITVLCLRGCDWYDFVSGDYASYEIKPTRIIKKISLTILNDKE